MTGKLSPAMADEIGARPMRARPDGFHEHEREPERWLRGVRKPTAEAFVKRGLADEFWRDSIGGYRVKLSEEGYALRLELLDDDR